MKTALALLLAGLVLAGCSDETTQPSGNTVGVNDNSFSPSTLTVTAGTTVTWDWNGGNSHNVTWVDGTPAASATQATGTYTRTFATAGAYDFYCTLHGTPTTGMRGSITVN
jgi:plastocyanin